VAELRRVLRGFLPILILILFLLMQGCTGRVGSYGNYRVLKSYNPSKLAIGFRNDDWIATYVTAALKVSAAEGTVHHNAIRWFGSDQISFPADPTAMDNIGAIPPRTLLVGCDVDVYPMSYMVEDRFEGFDVDIARDVCYRLGWSLYFIPIKAENAYIELSSGNIDVAWGGLALDLEATDHTVVYPYMTQEIVLVSRRDTKYRSLSSLKNAKLAMDSSQLFLDTINSDDNLKNSLGEIQRVQGGAEACFKLLNEGKVDCILVYKSALLYFGK
jgi:ABC-type amino acid transport substrate-binding protein